MLDKSTSMTHLNEMVSFTNVEDDSDQPDCIGKKQLDKKQRNRLLYGVNENPPWYTCFMLGLQHFFLMVESTVSVPYLLTPLMCMSEDDAWRGHIASTILFVCGIVTLMQTTFGVRLPIVQGGSHAFTSALIVLLSTMPCPSDEELSALPAEKRDEEWLSRMRTVQGAICIAALVQVVVGATGLVGCLLKWITPLTITPTVTLIGLSLVKVVTREVSTNWWISSFTVFLLVLTSQYLSNVGIPVYKRGKKKAESKVYIFQMFPVIISLSIAWLACYLLTVFDIVEKGNAARTDLKLNMVTDVPWFILPYPGQFGMPTPTVAGVLGVTAGIFATIIESVGDYYACSRMAGAPPPPTHAINRGIWVEGMGTILAGAFGTASGTTSFSQNVAAIGLTGVGSRRVVQYAAAIMLLCGVIGKLGAIFMIIPRPVIGGIFVIVFSMLSSVGLSSLQFVNLNSPRNLFVLGFSLFVALVVSEWVKAPENRGAIQTSSPILDQILVVLLGLPMFVGGTLGFFLDNTIPGTKEERGLLAWENQARQKSETSNERCEQQQTYDMPIGMDFITKTKWLRWVPLSPTFAGWSEIVKFRPSQRNRKENV